MAHGGALDSPSSQQTRFAPSRRSDLNQVQDENPVLLRQEKLGRRESRLGLRSIFGRSRAAKEPERLPPTIHSPRSTSIRSPMADMSHWPHGHSSDAALSSSPPWQQLPMTPETPELGQNAHHEQASAKRRRAASKPPKQPRETLANWSMPPLFKAFPQAVRHVTLPAATMSADAILRLNEKKNSAKLREEANVAQNETREGGKDDEKRKHRRNASVSAESLEWTTKIYILVTSGYVLQYAGDGHFDRLPEKVLRLGPSSAAFATDAIPGRHWVVHVSSTAEADGTPTPESRSFFSKLPFRMDRRNASNLLMVFESADVMEAWIAALRGEIEKLGGKKNLSETGKPKTEESTQHLRERHSQRTLIVRDLSRFSRSRGSRTTVGDRGRDSSDGSTRLASPDTIRDQSLDGESTTNSVVSQDERQLDNLRESSNRLSFISSGQRTIVTSTGSSPEGSPTRESFASHVDDMTARPKEYVNVVIRPRPNASDIAIRRQSVQVASPFVDPNSPKQAGPRPPSACVTVLRGDGVMSPLGVRPTPNFSVPHSSNRRFSYARAALAEADDSPPREQPCETFPRAARGRPPPVLRDTRPLSMVMDQPSPREIAPDRPTTGHRASRQVSPTKKASQQRLRSTSRGRDRLYGEPPSRRSSIVSKGLHDRRSGRVSPSPRRLSGVGTMWRQDDAVPRTGTALPPGHYREAHDVSSSPPPREDDREKYLSSFLDISGPRSRSVESSRAAKRASMNSILSERLNRAYDVYSPLVVEPPQAAPPNAPLPPIPGHASSPYPKVDMATKALFNRRSMPQLTKGPPPAPPPTRALPPIPQ
ncbi:Uncharacterized protein TPAR_05207 [Tolypocladium paradoxum]|uniref:Peptidase family M20/M25/M40 protein n=1 Tax=Tolypocladium paradoxum TaxID=94208 RepID=A0A2S4KWL8_9HYPO|nr:Uncharacterized protein TPAR_05207 [Tolypocladium paradoxum]